MEMIMQIEESIGRSRMCMEGCDFQGTRSVKRRRREHEEASLNCDDNPSQKRQQVDQNSITHTVKRSSRFRGVSRHKWTGRYEAHLWDKLSWNVTQKKKGKQGAYDEEESAARAYDLAALKYWGTSTSTNFPISDYMKEIEIMQTMTKEEYLATLRRKSSGFSRGVSKYRGVARHHQNGRWEARIGRVYGNKYLYLGTYSTQEEAARAYDIAAIEFRGIHAITNFDLSNYITHFGPARGNIQEPTLESQIVPEVHTMTPPFNHTSTEESKTLALDGNFLSTDYLRSSPKQEVLEKETAFISSSKSSSPTALGILLRSSIFRELVEKNLNMFGDEIDLEDAKDQQPHISGDDELSRIFYDSIGDTPFANDPERYDFVRDLHGFMNGETQNL
ncbi:hypothetical protein QN277_020630 [Acacia crassicarpa]|uniref:AP2/ERF domain-containing protein n=1 Tax=Acacia crassicarpa TaxID=499986 RepID=A0AAE1JPP0_9FABA|nr:hypothetical protein QN277_020630 [Acacia crassicarpa]